ncbi:TPA: hypothetical protein DCL22_02280 [Candidatus Moranbacteria bacterium]|nr:hypothetical protein [Candidatus Moranbacteria bacterium]
MFLEPKIKLKLVLGGILAAIVLSALNPFLISSEAFQGMFLVLDFLAVVYLWSHFNNLRVVINKKELEDEKLSKLERDVDRITHSKV